jgi:hypothetical protein
MLSAAPPALIDYSPGERRPVRSREASFKTRQQWGSIGTLILERLLGQETPPPTASTSTQRSDPENERFWYGNLNSASASCSPFSQAGYS